MTVAVIDAGRDGGPSEQYPTIDRDSPVPFYHQLKEILRARVTSGELTPGDRLEGEHVLCERYGVSRTVVRQALSDLHRENVLDKQKGRGTFIAHARTSQSLVRSLNGLYDDIRSLGRALRSEVRSLAVEPADADVAGRLGVPTDTPVVAIERLRFVDDEPWVFTVSHVPLTIAPDLVEQDLQDDSLYRLLRERYGHDIVRSHRVVEAHGSDARLARDLRIGATDPVLKLTGISYGADGEAVETFVAFHRADRSRFEVSLSRSDQDEPGHALVRLL